MQWYYVKDGERLGPVDEQDIQSMLADGRMTPADQVWSETFSTEWSPASAVPAFSAAKDVEQSVTPQVITPPAIPQKQATDPRGTGKSDGVSCTRVVGPAFARMKQILFSPFDIGKWFVLGFSAFLATLGQGGGHGGGGGGNGGGGSIPDGEDFDFDAIIHSCQEFLQEHPWIVPLVIGVVSLCVIVGVAVAWLRARGRFMFLDNVVNNRARISDPWKEFKQAGNSLFLWGLGYGLICLLVFAALAMAAYVSAIKPCIDAHAFLPSVIPGIVAVAIAATIASLFFAYVSRFLEDFVVPIMYRQQLPAWAAWGRFLELMKPSFGQFVLYGLFYGLLIMASGMAILTLILITCCIAACPLSIPYISSVLLLPVTVFFRAYSLEYLAQFGEPYDLFTPSA